MDKEVYIRWLEAKLKSVQSMSEQEIKDRIAFIKQELGIDINLFVSNKGRDNFVRRYSGLTPNPVSNTIVSILDILEKLEPEEGTLTNGEITEIIEYICDKQNEEWETDSPGWGTAGNDLIDGGA
jgi:hypothetical protein